MQAYAQKPFGTRAATRAMQPRVRVRASQVDLNGASFSGRGVAFDDFQTDARPVILYDGVCNLCNGAVNFMLDTDKRGAFRMAALQSSAGRRLLQRSGRRPDDISSIVLVDKEHSYIKSDAILRIAQGLSTTPLPLLALLGFPVPPFIRDFLYEQVADNRYNILGQRDVCRLSDAGFEDRFLTE